MPRWTIDSPATLDFDGVVALRVRIVAGSVAVLATTDRPRLERPMPTLQRHREPPELKRR